MNRPASSCARAVTGLLLGGLFASAAHAAQPAPRPPAGRPTPATRPGTAPPAATRPAAAPAAAPAEAVKMVGVWTCRPTPDEPKARRLIAERSKLPPDQHAAELTKLLAMMANYRLVYAFNADGTGVRSYGTDAKPAAAAIKWEVVPVAPGTPTRVAKGSKGPLVRVRVTMDGGATEDLDLIVEAADRVSVILPGATLPIVNPVTFTRGDGPAPVVGAAPAVAAGGGATSRPAGGAPAANPNDPDAIGAELAALGKKVAAELNAAGVAGLGVTSDGPDPRPETLVSSTYRLERVEVTTDGVWRLLINNTQVFQPDRGGNPYDISSQLRFDLRRDPAKWTCVRVIRTYFRDINLNEGRRSQNQTLAMWRFVDAGQGLAVPKARALEEADKPLPGNTADEAGNALAARLGKRVEVAVRNDAGQNPEFTGVTARPTLVQRTAGNGYHMMLFVQSDYDVQDPERIGPAEFYNVRSTLTVTVRPAADGRWEVRRAVKVLDGITGRRGPLNNGRGAPADWTADVQDWLDGKADVAPAANTRPASRPATRPAPR